jgi:hypothetical protein
LRSIKWGITGQEEIGKNVHECSVFNHVMKQVSPLLLTKALRTTANNCEEADLAASRDSKSENILKRMLTSGY